MTDPVRPSLRNREIEIKILEILKNINLQWVLENLFNCYCVNDRDKIKQIKELLE